MTVFTAKSELKAVDSARISINGHRKGDWKELVESEWRGKNNAFPELGLLLADQVFAESLGWEEENQLFVSLWEMGANSEAYSKHFEARGLSNPLH